MVDLYYGLFKRRSFTKVYKSLVCIVAAVSLTSLDTFGSSVFILLIAVASYFSINWTIVNTVYKKERKGGLIMAKKGEGPTEDSVTSHELKQVTLGKLDAAVSGRSLPTLDDHKASIWRCCDEIIGVHACNTDAQRAVQ